MNKCAYMNDKVKFVDKGPLRTFLQGLQDFRTVLEKKKRTKQKTITSARAKKLFILPKLVCIHHRYELRTSCRTPIVLWTVTRSHWLNTLSSLESLSKQTYVFGPQTETGSRHLHAGTLVSPRFLTLSF